MTSDRPGFSFPPNIVAELEAVAARENRSVDDVLSEVIARFLSERRESNKGEPRHSPQEAARLMLERRPFNKMPEGMTIREMMTYGRM